MSESIENQTFKKKFVFLFFGLIICGICVYYIYNSFQWKEIWTVLRKANPLFFFAGSIISLVLYWFTRCLRWYVLLKEDNKSVPFLKLYLYTAVTVSFSTITPFQAGEALKVELLKKHNAGRMSGYTNFAIERLMDLATILVFVLFGLSGQLDNHLEKYIYIISLGLSIFCIIFLFAIFFLPYTHFEKIRLIIKDRIKTVVLFQVTILTAISWFLTALGWHFALQSIGIYLDFQQTGLLLSLTTLASILSFVPGAVGVSELSISQILLHFGYPTNLAQSGALMIRGYALMILGLGFFHLVCLKIIERDTVENDK